MDKKIFKILFSLLLLESLLVVYAWFFPNLSFAIFDDKTVEIKFLSLDEIVSFNYQKQSTQADSLIYSYTVEKEIINTKDAVTRLKRRPLSFNEPRVVSKHMLNYCLDSINNEYCLDDFFRSLSRYHGDTLIRIAHYGDSQIEGDRITHYIREELHKKFGGEGIGYVPFNDITTHMNLRRTASKNWSRYTVFHNKYISKYYGLSGIVSRFMNYQPHDGDGYTAYNKASVTFDLYKRVSYKKATLLYGRNAAECIVNCYNGKNTEPIFSDKLPLCESFNTMLLDIPKNIESLRMEFVSGNSPEFYGVILDGNSGVQIDNYAIRGHSGWGLMHINQDYLVEQIQALNTKLFVFQFGNNVVPYIKSEKELKRFEDRYYKLFMKFHEAAPDASILVISAGDMAKRVNGKYVSYDILPDISDAQRRAAERAGCAFWDLFRVMGGMNSIQTWNKKKYASIDGHFTFKGQQVVASEFFSALMVEYNRFLYRDRMKKIEEKLAPVDSVMVDSLEMLAEQE